MPTHFSIAGQAIDSLDESCTELACPRCHLVIPRDLVELPPAFFSILGSPSSGKSYFLASSTWSLRKSLFNKLAIGFKDSDSGANAKLNEYEEILFQNDDEDQLVALPKTEMDGELYQQVEIEHGRTMLLPQPFMFRARLKPTHPNVDRVRRNGRAICLYDNAGEHFLPGAQTANAPGTRHLIVSRAILFVFDPTQHQAFRKACRGRTNDPQVTGNLVSYPQSKILVEAAGRIRAETGPRQNQLETRPLIVVLSKFDAWSSLLNVDSVTKDSAIKKLSNGYHALDAKLIQSVSDACRELLLEHAGEIVDAAEEFAENVTYIPVSALGCSPVEMANEEPVGDPPRRPLGVYPSRISPVWSDVPLLYAIHKTLPAMVGYASPRTKSKGA